MGNNTADRLTIPFYFNIYVPRLSTLLGAKSRSRVDLISAFRRTLLSNTTKYSRVFAVG